MFRWNVRIITRLCRVPIRAYTWECDVQLRKLLIRIEKHIIEQSVMPTQVCGEEEGSAAEATKNMNHQQTVSVAAPTISTNLISQ